jgi:dienelactone hydrolase
MMFHVERVAIAAFMGLGTLAAGAQETVAVPGPGVQLKAVVHRPEGNGPFPAILLLHGCSGLWGRNGEPTASHTFWADHFRQRGYVAVLLDSFGPRGEKEICTQQTRRVRPDRERVDDAWAARRWLAADPDIDPRRIFVMGWSNGATTVLNAVLRRPPVPGQGFRAAVAFYPGCRVLARRDSYHPHAPVLILAGGADDWTPAADCVALAKSAGPGVEIDVYEGAHHAFDRVDGRVRHRPDVRNLNSPSGRGATVGPHPEARKKALQRVTEYLDKAADRVPRGTSGAGTPSLP